MQERNFQKALTISSEKRKRDGGYEQWIDFSMFFKFSRRDLVYEFFKHRHRLF